MVIVMLNFCFVTILFFFRIGCLGLQLLLGLESEDNGGKYDEFLIYGFLIFGNLDGFIFAGFLSSVK